MWDYTGCDFISIECVEKKWENYLDVIGNCNEKSLQLKIVYFLLTSYKYLLHQNKNGWGPFTMINLTILTTNFQTSNLYMHEYN